MKLHVSPAEYAWLLAFEKVKKLGEGAVLGGWTVLWVHEEPHWLHVGRKKEKRMVKQGDPFIHELIGATEGKDSHPGGVSRPFSSDPSAAPAIQEGLAE